MPSTPFNPSTPNGEDVNSFHLKDDVDKSALSHHHTLGVGDTQASPGSHRHNGTDSYQIDYNDLLNLPSGTVADYTSTIKHEVKLGEAIAKGQAVYVSSADGTNMIVSKASNASEATSSKTLGLLETGGSTNTKVNVITEGLLAGLDTSTATAGDPVWLGTSGNLIYGLANKPVAPAHLVFIGIVTRVNSNNGEIFVRPQNGFELNEIHDVLITSVATGEIIQRTASNLWENKTLAEANIATADHTHTGVYAPASHTHDDRYYTESEITSLLSGKSDTGHTHTGVYSPVGHSHEIADVNGLATVLSDKADEVHTHIISDVTGLQAELDEKALAEGYTVDRVLVSNGAGAIAVSPTITTTELGYLNGVTDNIQTQLDGKIGEIPTEIGNAVNLNDYTSTGLFIQSSNAEAATGSNYPAAYAGLLEVYARADAAFVYQRYTTYQPYNIVYHRSNYTGTWSSWKGVSSIGHSHSIADVTGLSTSLADKADAVHSHAISDVTGLQAALDDKALAEGYTADRVLVSNGAGAIGVSTTVDTTELGYLNGVTSNIQTQLGNKANSGGYTASRVLVTDGSGDIVVHSLISPTELDYLDNVTSNIQTQLNGKSATGHTHIIAETTGLQTALDGKASSTHTHTIANVTGLQTTLDGKAANSGYTGSRVLVTLSDGSLSTSATVDTTELGYLNGATSSIQTQLNAKAEAGSNGVPFAMAANRTTTAGGTALAANAQETATTVTFPTSRFSVVPSVTANTSSPRYVVAVGSVATTGFTMTVRNVSDATGTTYTWNWMAIQMTSGAVSG